LWWSPCKDGGSGEDFGEDFLLFGPYAWDPLLHSLLGISFFLSLLGRAWQKWLHFDSDNFHKIHPQQQFRELMLLGSQCKADSDMINFLLAIRN
jgi:hypothetical protein